MSFCIRGFCFIYRLAIELFCFVFFFLFREDEVEDNGDNEYDCYAVFSEDVFDQFGEDFEDGRGLGEADADADCEGGDGDVACAISAAGNHLYAGKYNRAEHHQGTSAKYGFRQRGEQYA